jgi:hypothetical protein
MLTWKTHNFGVDGVAFSPDGRKLHPFFARTR